MTRTRTSDRLETRRNSVAACSYFCRIAGGKSRSSPPGPTRYSGFIPALCVLDRSVEVRQASCEDVHQILIGLISLEDVANREKGMLTKRCRSAKSASCSATAHQTYSDWHH